MLHKLKEPRSATSGFIGFRVSLGNRNSVSLSKVVNRLRETEILDPLDECKRISSGTTTKTLEDLLGFTDRE
jgi:hypothetical protein